MSQPTDERIIKLNHAYDLDGGGYTFEDPPEGLKGLACYIWDDPDPDYVPWIVGDDSSSARHDFYGLSCPVYAFAPNSGHFAATVWPESFQDSQGDTFTLIRQGRLNESEHECNCHGKLEQWTGAAGEPNESLPWGKVILWAQAGKATIPDVLGDCQQINPLFWEFTGTPSDKPHPECTRCEGTGHVDSPGGEWAAYAVKDTDQE